MAIKALIIKQLKTKESIKVADIVRVTGFSRTYINRFFQELRNEGKIVLIGKTNKANYVLAEKGRVLKARQAILSTRQVLVNKNLSEDTVLDAAKRDSGVFINLGKNTENILDYAFTEMLNNAIDHSQSDKIEIRIKRSDSDICFDIIDHGVGIFNNIMTKKGLKNELEAIQDLLKGKQTTAPQAHSGEGIFFTSKAADNFVVESSTKKLIFNNKIDDIFIQDIKDFRGTRIIFTIAIRSHKDLGDIFKEYSGESFEFNRTKVAVRLYKMGSLYMSRSQARRIMNGLEKFKTVFLDFNHIKNVGQAFVDEIFRIWRNHHPEIEIDILNVNENVDFMIKRVTGQESVNQQRLF